MEGAQSGGTGRGRSRSKSTTAARANSKADSTADDAVKVEKPMAQEKATDNGGSEGKAGKLELSQKPEPSNGTALSRADAQPSVTEIEITRSYSMSGSRPVAASHLEIYGTILNNRPIAASHLRVLDHGLPGHRPVFASDLVVRDDLTLPGGRPIMASDPHLMEGSHLPGGRPIASNEIDDSEGLMGYID